MPGWMNARQLVWNLPEGGCRIMYRADLAGDAILFSGDGTIQR